MIELNPKQEKLKRQVTNPAKFKLFLFTKLPMGLLAGMRLRSLTPESCTTSVPFKNLNKNPFKSIYFAVQSMAAELSTATPCLLAVQGHKPSIAFIIVDLKANFYKKATGRVYFHCDQGSRAFNAVAKAISSGEAQTATFNTIGKMEDGTIVSDFEFTWSFKQRSKP
ncbi:MAG: thioesterase [Cyclobacteriaceae bacterium]